MMASQCPDLVILIFFIFQTKEPKIDQINKPGVNGEQ